MVCQTFRRDILDKVLEDNRALNAMQQANLLEKLQSSDVCSNLVYTTEYSIFPNQQQYYIRTAVKISVSVNPSNLENARNGAKRPKRVSREEAPDIPEVLLPVERRAARDFV